MDMKGWCHMNNNLEKGICLGIYAGTAIFGAKKNNWSPLAGVVTLHTVEYLTSGRKIGKAAGLSESEIASNCLLFGIAWWKPLKEKLEAAGKEAMALEELRKEGLLDSETDPKEKFAKKGCGVRFVKEAE